MALIQFEHLSSIIRGRPVLTDISWKIEQDQNWAILGPNGAGKTALLKVILGKLYYRGDFSIQEGLRGRAAYVSFDKHTHLIHREDRKDLARDYSRKPKSNVITAKHLLLDRASADDIRRNSKPLTDLLQIRDLLGRDIRYLSTGEMRKTLIAGALMSSPQVLILDEPYDGLDDSTRQFLGDVMDRLMAAGTQMVLVTHRIEEIPDGISHILCMKDGKIFRKGKKESILKAGLIDALYGHHPLVENLPEKDNPSSFDGSGREDQALISIKNATVKYGDSILLDQVNWQMNPGENWLITGPNGAGKTTLISLITADHPQAYANDISLFGKRRGTGESIWDIKQRIGQISSEFQIRYGMPKRPMTVFQVVLSGFHDSVGIFRSTTQKQRAIARQWLEKLSLTQYSERIYDRLSYGEQRMTLLARAMVKSPTLLILDEPFQGVDYVNREMLLHLVDIIGMSTDTNVIYITHQREHLDCITHELLFLPYSGGGYQVLSHILNGSDGPRIN